MTKTGNKAVRSEAGKLALGLVFVALVIIPLLKMFSFIEGQGFIRLVRSPVFGRAALHSLSASLFATVISVTLAFLLAWCLRRTRMKGTGVFSVLFILPMLIPSVSIGMGLTILFGSNDDLRISGNRDRIGDLFFSRGVSHAERCHEI